MLKLKIIAKDRILYQGQANSVIIPTKMGIIEVLPNHMALVSALSAGEIILKNDKENSANGERIKFVVQSGVLEVRPKSEVIILVN